MCTYNSSDIFHIIFVFKKIVTLLFITIIEILADARRTEKTAGCNFPRPNVE